MLTTTDNPYNPYTEYNKWYAWDLEHGYNTIGYLGEVYAILEASGLDEDEAMNKAYEDILEQNIYGNYVLVPEPIN